MDSYQDGTTMFTDLIAIEKMVTVDALQTQCMVYMHISHAGAALLLFLVPLQTCTQAHDTVVMITFFMILLLKSFRVNFINFYLAPCKYGIYNVHFHIPEYKHLCCL